MSQFDIIDTTLKNDEVIILNSIQNLITNGANIKDNEKVLIIYDDTTINLLDFFKKIIYKYTTQLCFLKTEISSSHGEEPSLEISQTMNNSDVILCLTQKSLAHTKARINANKNGARFLSLPDYNISLLKDKSINVNFQEYLKDVEKVTELLTKGGGILITTQNGTYLQANIDNRKGNCCPGFVNSQYLLGSPPDIEANIAPIENLSEGTIMVDGSITCPEIGLLQENVKLEIKEGKIHKITSDKYTKILEKILDISSKKVLAEIGIGFNKEANLCGNMLIDEGSYGCVHFGFGSNITIGGQNQINFHLDFVIKQPTLMIDGIEVIKNGEFKI